MNPLKHFGILSDTRSRNGTCYRCGAPTTYYSGALGYESMRCTNKNCRHEYAETSKAEYEENKRKWQLKKDKSPNLSIDDRHKAIEGNERVWCEQCGQYPKVGGKKLCYKCLTKR